MVTGDATTAVVTHALHVGSRLEACRCCAPLPPMPEDIVRREAQERAHATRRAGRGQPQKRCARRVRTAQFEQLNRNAAGIDVGAEAHWMAVPRDRDAQPVQQFGTFTANAARRRRRSWQRWRDNPGGHPTPVQQNAQDCHSSVTPRAAICLASPEDLIRVIGLTACSGDSWRDTVQNIPMML